jgi:hypothetical protein
MISAALLRYSVTIRRCCALLARLATRVPGSLFPLALPPDQLTRAAACWKIFPPVLPHRSTSRTWNRRTTPGFPHVGRSPGPGVPQRRPHYKAPILFELRQPLATGSRQERIHGLS